MDPLLALVLVLLALIGGAALGYALGHRAGAARPALPPAPICTCDHGYGEHGEDGCAHVETERVMIRDDSDYRINSFGESVLKKAAQEWATTETPCRCRRYIGPEPLASMWNAPMIGGV